MQALHQLIPCMWIKKHLHVLKKAFANKRLMRPQKFAGHIKSHYAKTDSYTH